MAAEMKFLFSVEVVVKHFAGEDNADEDEIEPILHEAIYGGLEVQLLDMLGPDEDSDYEIESIQIRGEVNDDTT